MADTKTVDGGQLEAEMVFGAGAAFMTVLSSTSKATHDAVGRVAADYGATVVVDTITEFGQEGASARERCLFPTASPMSAFICRPTPVTPATGRPRISTPSPTCIGAAFASRSRAALVPTTIDAVLAVEPEILIVGSAITGSEHPAGDGKVDTGQN